MITLYQAHLTTAGYVADHDKWYRGKGLPIAPPRAKRSDARKDAELGRVTYAQAIARANREIDEGGCIDEAERPDVIVVTFNFNEPDLGVSLTFFDTSRDRAP